MTTSPPPPTLTTPAEVARALRVSEHAVRRWLRTGELEGVRLGSGKFSRYRVSQEQLARFIHEAGPAPEEAGPADE